MDRGPCPIACSIHDFQEHPEALSTAQIAQLGRQIVQLPEKNDALAQVLRQLIHRESWDELESLVKEWSRNGYPAHPELLFCMGLYFDKAQKNIEGLACLERAVALSPRVAMYHNNLGVFLERLKRHDDAYAAYSKAAELNPDEPLHAVNLAKICIHHLDRFREGMRHYNYAIALDFENTDLLLNTANAFHKFGFRREAVARARLAIRLAPGRAAAIFLKPTFFLSVSYETVEQMQDLRRQMETELQKLPAEVDAALASPGYAAEKLSSVAWPTLFLLAYQGGNDVKSMQAYSRELARALRPYFSRVTASGDSAPDSGDGKRKLRIGICTAFLYHHSVWKIPLHGIYQHLNRRKFEIHSFHMGGLVDFATEDIKSRSDSYFRTEDVHRMAERLAGSALDILVFPETGMDSATFLLCMTRFAPVQCQALGHPVTSGSDAIDYVLSSDLMEPAGGQAHYTEKLVRLPGLGVTYSYPYQFHAGSKQEFGLPQDAIVFLSPQSIFKYLPENDDIYPAIARQLPKARFVFIGATAQRDTQKFEQRLQRSFQQAGLDHRQFVSFIPGQGKEGFMKACQMADVFIDNPSWSGHNTILDALHSHTPVVTQRGDAMRKNHGAAILEFLGLGQHVAEGKTGFIGKCVEFGSSAELRKRFSETVPGLLERLRDVAPIRALEDFFEEASASAAQR